MRASRLLHVFATLALVTAWALPAFALTPGELDPTFGHGGKATAMAQGSVGYAVAVDSQGRTVAAGYTLNGRPDFAVARFLQNGTLDTTFGDLGRTILDLGGADYAYSLAIQSDGKIVLAGESDKAGKSRIAVARFNGNGHVDSTFGGTKGYVLTSFGKDQQAANSVIVTPDDKIVVAGFTSGGVNARAAIVRYSPTGHLDGSFGGDGKVSFDFSHSDEQFEAISWDAGNYVLAGYAEVNLTPTFLVADVSASNGKLNGQFSHNGWTTTNVTSGADIGFDIVRQPDGKIIVAGRVANNGRDDWGVVRYLANGGLDASWGNNGRVVTSFGSAFDVAYGIALQSNGKVVVVGRIHRTNGTDFGLVRYNTDGSLNRTFGGNGKVITDFALGDDGARGVVIASNGKIVVIGDATKNGIRRMALARYAP